MNDIEKRRYEQSFETLLEDFPALEFPPITDNNTGQGDVGAGAADIAYQAEIIGQPVEPGTTVEETKVVSVYDARPINAIDFVQTLSGGIDAGGLFANLNFIVPSGLTMILKHFSFFVPIDTAPAVDQFGQELFMSDPLGVNGTLLFSININGIGVPAYTLKVFGINTERFPCYVLAAENSIINFNFRSTVDAFILTAQTVLYGQFLLSSGKTLNLQPGNEVRQPPPPVQIVKSAPPARAKNYMRYVAILNAAMQHIPGQSRIQIPPFSAYKAGEAKIWGDFNRKRGSLFAIVTAVKNLTGKDL